MRAASDRSAVPGVTEPDGNPGTVLAADCRLQARSSACVVFLGCPKNQIDSEHVLGSLTQAGYALTTEPAHADLIVITTCAFLQSAVRESEAAIREALKHKQGSTGKAVVVAGCIVERYGSDLKGRFPAVDHWVRLRDMNRVPQLAAGGRKLPAPGLGQSAACNVQPAVGNGSPRVLSTPGHFAYLKVADGCDNRCSYCLIPDIRGSFRSRPMKDILAEAGGLAERGVKELILVAQDTTLYGSDIYGRPTLAKLLRRLGDVKGIRWLRLMYTHPAHLTEDVMNEMCVNPKLCRYVDLPIQHISDRLLTRMNRRHTRSDVEALLDNLRTIPDMHIRTTIIVGLPGETRRDFEELLAFVRKARFDRLSCYAYSPEPGTSAARLPGQVSPQVKKARVRRLMLTQAAVSRANLRRLVGRDLDVLVDSPGIARSEFDAPEIDGLVKLTGRAIPPGRFHRVRVTTSSTHDLTARVL
jgi:ribosomal protein S12 methylthiotransferase